MNGIAWDGRRHSPSAGSSCITETILALSPEQETQPKTWRPSPQGDVGLMTEKQVLGFKAGAAT